MERHVEVRVLGGVAVVRDGVVVPRAVAGLAARYPLIPPESG
jgi:hypothetical protein